MSGWRLTKSGLLGDCLGNPSGPLSLGYGSRHFESHLIAPMAYQAVLVLGPHAIEVSLYASVRTAPRQGWIHRSILYRFSADPSNFSALESAGPLLARAVDSMCSLLDLGGGGRGGRISALDIASCSGPFVGHPAIRRCFLLLVAGLYLPRLYLYSLHPASLPFRLIFPGYWFPSSVHTIIMNTYRSPWPRPRKPVTVSNLVTNKNTKMYDMKHKIGRFFPRLKDLTPSAQPQFWSKIFCDGPCHVTII